MISYSILIFLFHKKKYIYIYIYIYYLLTQCIKFVFSTYSLYIILD